MEKKVLFAANLDSFFMKFLIPQLKYFKEHGYIVHVASRGDMDIPYCDKKFNVDFARGLSIKDNFVSYRQMKNIFKENHYDIVSCHTPFGAFTTRLAFKKCKVENTQMVYMCHGFHFYKGAPILNWLLFYPVEKYLAKYTDDLITINSEDYERAKKKFETRVHYVHGVGMDADKFNFEMTNRERTNYRRKLGLKKEDFVMIFPAELSKPKRHKWLIKTLNHLLKTDSRYKVLLPGKDSLNGEAQGLIDKYNLNDQIKLLGFRTDIPQLLKISDLAISSSNREGLPVNIMEAMYCELPIVATYCRGNRDLVEDGKNGFVVGTNDSQEFCNRIIYYFKTMDDSKALLKKYDRENIKPFLVNEVIKEIMKVYGE